jgi:P-type Ca2+ transporter type 2C
VSVICSDKTGTLTRNEMTVRTVAAGGTVLTVSGVGYAPDGGFHRDDEPDGDADETGCCSESWPARGAVQRRRLRAADGDWVRRGRPDGGCAARAGA